MKKSFIVGIMLFSILSLAACGKKDEPVVEENHNYAVNPVKEQSEDELTNDSSETPDSVDMSVYDNYNNEDKIIYTENEIAYPTMDDDSLYIAGMPIAKAIPYNFIYNDLTVSCNTAEENMQESLDNHIYAQGYNNLHLTDLEYNSNTLDTSLLLFEPAVKTITIGNIDFTTDELFRSTDNLNELLILLNNSFTSKSNFDPNDIEGSAYKVESNEEYGETYTWIFSVNDENLEYPKDIDLYKESICFDDEEDSELSNEPISLNTNVIVEAVHTADGSLRYYNVTVQRRAHIWYTPNIIHRTEIHETDEYDTKYILFETNESINEEDLSKYSESDYYIVKQPIMEYTDVYELSDTCSYKAVGYDFSYNYITLYENSIIGIDNFSYTIHNPETNKNLYINYTAK